MRNKAAFLLTILFSLLIGIGAARADSDPPTITFGRAAPDFAIKNADGKTLSLKDFRGKTVILTFWSSGCDKCIDQLRKVRNFVISKKYKDVEFIFITKPDKPEEKEKARRELDDMEFKYTLGFVPDNNLAWQYAVTVIPAFFIIDKKGSLQSSGISFPDSKLVTKTFLDILDLVERGKKVSACEFMPPQRDNPYLKFVGKPGVDVEAVDAKGKKQASYFYRGFSRLLLVYWLPTCPHCRRELPHINTFYKNKNKYNIEVLGIVGSNDADMKKLTQDYIQSKDIAFPIAFDDGKAMAPYGVKAFPSLILLDRKGNVAQTFEGEFPFAEDVLRCTLDKIKD